MNTRYRAYHNVHGMIPEEEYFTLEDAVNGDLTFFGSPAKDFDTHDFIFMPSVGARDKNRQEVFKDDLVWFGKYDPETGKKVVSVVDFQDYQWVLVAYRAFIAPEYCGGWDKKLVYEFPERTEVVGTIYDRES